MVATPERIHHFQAETKMQIHSPSIFPHQCCMNLCMSDAQRKKSWLPKLTTHGTSPRVCCWRETKIGVSWATKKTSAPFLAYINLHLSLSRNKYALLSVDRLCPNILNQSWLYTINHQPVLTVINEWLLTTSNQHWPKPKMTKRSTPTFTIVSAIIPMLQLG